jgi:hypothetical protein
MILAPTTIVVAAEAPGDQLAAHYRRIGIAAVFAAVSSTKTTRPAAPARPTPHRAEDFVD